MSPLQGRDKLVKTGEKYTKEGVVTIGIYSITNTVDGKRYIGKSKNIEKRFQQHIHLLSKEDVSRDVNRHLFNAVKKYGMGVFKFEIIEQFDEVDEALLADREIYWMEEYNTLDRTCGYNLLKDSSARTIIHPETIEIFRENNLGEMNPNYGNRWTQEQKDAMRAVKISQHRDGSVYGSDWRAKLSEASTEKWKDEELKMKMARSVSKAKTKYRFYQYDKVTLQLVRVWDSMADILEENTDYHNIAIYSVANGHKKSYRGYIWKKELKNL